MRTSPNSQFSQTSSIGHGVGRSLSSTAVSQKQRVVILGSGWGGYGLLRGIDKGRYGACVCVCSVIQKPTMIAWIFWPDVVVIPPNTYFNFTPLLASTSVGTLEFRTAVEPVSRHMYSHIDYVSPARFLPRFVNMCLPRYANLAFGLHCLISINGNIDIFSSVVRRNRYVLALPCSRDPLSSQDQILNARHWFAFVRFRAWDWS